MTKRELKQKDVEETTVVTEPTESVIEEETVAPIQMGTVTGCLKLNVRKKPSIKSDPICTVDAKTKLVILESDNADWYKVEVEKGVEGYCMKKYVDVK